jgi:hypothetical protein
MRRYVIERDLPGVGGSSTEKLNEVRETSNAVLRDMGPDIQWVESFVTADRIYCVYLAENEQMAREHAKRAGIPASKISEVKHVVDTLMATAQHA